MHFSTPYLSYRARVRKELPSVFFVFFAFTILGLIERDRVGVQGVFALAAVLAGICLITILADLREFVNEVRITDAKIIVIGYSFDRRWEKVFEIPESKIKVRTQGGRIKVDYYLRVTSGHLRADINRSKNFDYQTLLTIFHEFKTSKGEKIIIDEKLDLQLIHNKIDGLRPWDLPLKRDPKK